MHSSATRVSVIGGSTVTDEEYEQARTVGRLLGERGYPIVCGGRGGVMEGLRLISRQQRFGS